MREIVLNFKDGEKEFIIFKDDNKYIPCKQDGNDISFDLNQEEFNIVKYVFNKIKVTNNRVELPNVEYKGKEFKHFYDKTNDFNIFLNIDGSEISKEEYKYFNKLYNYQDNIMYSSDKKGNLDDNFIKRIINYGGKALVVFLTSTMLVGCASKQSDKTPKVEVGEQIEHVVDDIELTYIGKENIDTKEEVKVVEENETAIAKTKKEKLTETANKLATKVYEESAKTAPEEKKEVAETAPEEKYYLYKYEKTDSITGEKSIILSEEYLTGDNYVLEEKITYLSYDQVINNLNNQELYPIISSALGENNNLSDEIKKEIKGNSFKLAKDLDYIDTDLLTERLKSLDVVTDEVGSEKSGEYDPMNNRITIYGLGTNIFCDETKTEMFRDILSHEIRHVTQKATNYAGLYESMTKYLNDEYIEKDDYLSTYFNILTKIVSIDSLKKYYYNNNMDYLKEELMDIYKDEIDQYQLLNNFSALYNNRYLSNYEELDAKSQELGNARSLENDLDRLYMKKYDKSMYSDPEVRKLLANVHEINNDVLGYQCVSQVYDDDAMKSDVVNIDGHDYVTILPIVKNYEGKKTIVAPNGYILKENKDPEFISSQVRKMVEDDFNNKEAEIIYQRSLTTIFDGYQYLNEKDKLEGYVKIGVSQSEKDVLNIDIKDATLEEEDAKLRFSTEYAKYLAGELLNNKQNSEETNIEVSLNGKILTINDKTNFKVYNIDIENGSHPVFVQMLNQANISGDEYSALLNGEIQNNIYNTKNKFENYSNEKPEEIGIDNKGNIITYVNINLKDSESNINNMPITINPSDAINYTHHSKGRGNI